MTAPVRRAIGIGILTILALGSLAAFARAARALLKPARTHQTWLAVIGYLLLFIIFAGFVALALVLPEGGSPDDSSFMD